MNHRRIFAMWLAASLLAGAACTASAASFNCATATTLREKAVCRDQRLAALDQDIAAAYARALRRFDSADAARLRRDQHDFITEIDDGFKRMLTFGHAPENDDTLNEALARRSGEIGELEDVLSRRLRFLRSLEPGRQTLTGKWQNTSATLSVMWENTAFAVAFEYRLFGYLRYDCVFEDRFAVGRGGLRGTITHLVTHLESDDEEVHSEVALQRRGATLELREEEPLKSICPHRAQLHEVLFPVVAAE